MVWDKARKQAMNGDLQSAAMTYRQVLVLKTDLDEASWELANVLFSLGNYTEAQAIAEILVERDPERPDYLNGLAALDLKVGKFGRAAELFKSLYRKDNDDTRALAGAVYGYLRDRQPKAALPLLKALANRAASVPGLPRFLGHLAYEQGDYATAKKEFLALTHYNTAAPALLIYAARSLAHLGQEAQAARYWQRLLLKKPDMVEAHKWLGHYFEKQGQVGKALPHLLFLHRRMPATASLLKRLGRCYVGLKKFPQALQYLQKYLLKKPTDVEAARLVVNLAAASGNKAATLAALKHYFDIESHPDKVNLEKAAKLYGEKGLYRQALDIWQKLLAMAPDNPQILAAMAHNFLAIGKNEDALRVWRKLAEVSPNVIDVYRPMAVLLERMGRWQELVEVLETIHALKPHEQDISLKLAILYVRQKNYKQAGKLFDLVTGPGRQRADFLYWHAVWAQAGNDLLLALRDFEGLLKISPARQDVRTRCMVIAGRLGNLVLVRRYCNTLKVDLSAAGIWQFKAAAAFQDCGAYDEAEIIFRRIFNAAIKMPNWPKTPAMERRAGRAARHLAEIYRAEGRGYETEEFLRIGLLVSPATGKADFAARLFDLSWAAGNVAAAADWYAVLRQQAGADPWYLQLRQAKLWQLQGKTRQAARLAKSLLTVLQERDGVVPKVNRLKRYLTLADFLQGVDSGQAAAVCRTVLAEKPGNRQAMLMLAGLNVGRRAVLLRQFETLTAGELLDYARLAQKNGQPRLMNRAASLAQDKMPGSLMAAILAAQSLKMQGDPSAAEAWRKLTTANPGNSFIASRAARTAFFSGDMAEALALCQPLQAWRPDMALLTARILWMQNDWPRALHIYKKFLTPGVDNLLRRAAKRLDIQLPVPAQQRSFWQRISLSPAPAPVADVLMTTDYFHQPDGSSRVRRFQLAVSRLFALYHWQDKFAAELLVRQAVQSRAYFTAQQRYEALIGQYPADKSLQFGLAGVYSQLGRLDDEAVIYDNLQADGVNFPALRDDARRNKLKRQPCSTAAFVYLEEEGRNGYKDMRLISQYADFQISPRPGKKFKLRLTHNNYHGVNADGTLHSARIMAAYQARVLHHLTINLGGGVESLDRSGMNTTLLDLSLVGKLNDKLSGRVSFLRDIVADTLFSVNRGIYKQDLAAGLSFEPLSRLALGGNYGHLKYSDHNWTTTYDLWSSFLIHSEPLFLQIKYQYEFKNSADGTGTGPTLVDSPAAGGHSYWSPKNYWTNQVGIYFKHILSHQHLNRDTSKYYTLEYYLGHDNGGYGFQRAKGRFCLEFSPNFTVQAGVELFSSAVYRRKQYSISLSYRW